ncbi:hypothetical protein Pint_28687 [Pistacia integerrima]|uniref:Uncharacterized protein n=1 Tax=Pistacia integerrima TaxID=434235 RepID=A0ACC0YQ39_9ROSI|nr:hypothetical protein Pint_28687 [Pistacia integerrima]
MTINYSADNGAITGTAGLLPFHPALVCNPQDAFVIWIFASVLYHGKWEKGVKFATLVETDSTVRLAIPTSALPHFENFGGRDLLVRDWTGQEWKFCFSIRKVGHPGPVFTGDWVRFAQAKRLQLNDLLSWNTVNTELRCLERPILSYWVKK